MTETFKGNFTQQLPLPEAAIEAALRVMHHGRLHRYNIADDEISEAAALEREFAAYLGVPHCVALASGGAAMALALRAVGVRPGDRVLSNAFTLAPVPGAIAAVGAEPEFVGVTRSLTIDLDHLAERIAASDAKVLLLSHMRGHICDMDALMALCGDAGVIVVEDCAHTMGARWKGVHSGLHGAVGCYSTQTYKHMNSGEGGLLVTSDPEIAGHAILLSGSYMFHDRHGAGPAPEVLDGLKLDVPNMSCRMDNLRAAILRPQLARLDENCAAWGRLYAAVEDGLRNVPGLTIIERPAEEAFVGSSIQFLLNGWSGNEIEDLLGACRARGVELKWFGAATPVGFTSTYAQWRYADAPAMPDTDAVLAGLMDMRLPLTFDVADCAVIARIIASEVTARMRNRQAAE